MKRILSFRLISVFLLMGVLVIIFSSCNTLPSPTPQVTAVLTKTPISVTQRHGGWLDEIDFSVIKQDSAVTQLQAGVVDIYANGLASSDFPAIKKAGLKYIQYNGWSYSLMFNPAVFADAAKLNPFSDRNIREAMNWLVDRNFINQEIYAGGSLPKFFPIQTNGPDYADLADVVRRLENKYAYNPELAQEGIAKEMQGLGAVLKDGKWSYKDQPVTLAFMIRPDGDGTRKPIGNYVATQLESIGFTVDRQYKDADAAAPIRQGDPTSGQWNLYTPGWISTSISRDDKYTFQSMYLDSSSLDSEPFLSNTHADPEFKKLGDDLANARFPDLAARRAMMAKALELSLQDSLQVWLVDSKTFAPYSQNVDATYDLAAGIESAQIWPYTLRFSGKEGGQLKWATSNLFGDPWNPVAGTNWDYDQGAIRATSSGGVMIDPYTGLVHPLRIEKAEVVAQVGLPVIKTLDWVDLKFQKEIKIPGDTLVDWDAEKQVFITAGQMAPRIAAAEAAVDAYKTRDADITPKLKAKAAGLVAGLKLTSVDAAAIQGLATQLAAAMKELGGGDVDVAAIFASGDGKAVLDQLVATLAAPGTTDKPALKDEEKTARIIEFALSYVKVFAPDDATLSLAARDYASAKIKSVVYYPADLFDKVKWHDGSKLSAADFLMGMIMTFDRADPKSRIYDPAAVPNFHAFIPSFKGFKIVSTRPLGIEYYTDAYTPDAELNVFSLWPGYGYGEGAWHEIAIGNLAEGNGELAYSHEKADKKKIEQTSLVGGPSLPILAKYLDQAASEGYIPYAATLGQYISADDARARYANLKKFAADHGHYWIGTGPYILDKVFMNAKSLVLKNNPEYPDLADRWSGFGEPKIAFVAPLHGPDRVKIGAQASFDVFITFKGQPYLASDIKAVKYLYYNARNEVAYVGEATLVTDGQYKIVLTADQTSKLEAGSNRLEVVVTTLPVSIPTFVSFDFLTTK